jgi:flagellar hook-associated protein 3 FlgL
MVKSIEMALRTDDKATLQSSLENIDEALSQVILARSQVGSRSMVLNNSLETLQKGKVDAQAQISNLEDADAFKVISDINKTESTLQATLATSGKMMQSSLMDFIR